MKTTSSRRVVPFSSVNNLRVPHSCVLCKGGNIDPLSLGIEALGKENQVSASHPFTQYAKGRGTCCTANAREIKAWATRPGGQPAGGNIPTQTKNPARVGR